MFSSERDPIGSIATPLKEVPLSIGGVHLRRPENMRFGQKVIIVETQPVEFKLFTAGIDCNRGLHSDVKNIFTKSGIKDENTVGGLEFLVENGSVSFKGWSTQFGRIPEEIRQRFAHLLLPTLAEILHDDYISLDQNHHSPVENTPTPVDQLHDSWFRFSKIRDQAQVEWRNSPERFDARRKRLVQWQEESSVLKQVPLVESKHQILVP